MDMAIRTAERRKKKDVREILFLVAILIIPVTQFCIMYIGVNFNSILVSFSKYRDGDFLYAGLVNYKAVFSDMFVNGVLRRSFVNSAIIYLVNTLLCFPIQLFIAFLIWRKITGSGFFKVMMFVPSILPGIVLVIIFKYFVEKCFPAIFRNPNLAGLLYNPGTGFYTVLIYTFWVGFASGLIIYLGSMSNTSKDIVEYGKIDGLGMLGEFWHIVLPAIFPTVVTFTVVGVVGFFTNNCNVYSFYGNEANSNFYNLGYYYFVKVVGGNNPQSNYPYASALGIVFTLFTIPLAFGVRYLMEKLGPKE